MSENTKQLNFYVMELCNNYRSMNGLKHQDYQRYREYLTRALYRLRKTIKRQEKIKNRKMLVNYSQYVSFNEKFFYMLLLQAERCWSYAMQLKQLTTKYPRKRHHFISKLVKSILWAVKLDNLVNSQKTDARSKLETSAYLNWMKGNLAFEKEDFKVASLHYSNTNKIYQGLMPTLNPIQERVYKSITSNIETLLRYCSYELTDDPVDPSKVINLSDDNYQNQDIFNSKLEELIENTVMKHSENYKSILWENVDINVRDEKCLFCLIQLMESPLLKECYILPLVVSVTFMDKKMDKNIEDVKLKKIYRSANNFNNIIVEALESLKKKNPNLDPDMDLTKSENDSHLFVLISYIYLMNSIVKHFERVREIEKIYFKLKNGAKKSTDFQILNSKHLEICKIYNTILKTIEQILKISVINKNVNYVERLEALKKYILANQLLSIAYNYEFTEKIQEASILYKYIMNSQDYEKCICSLIPKKKIDQFLNLTFTFYLNIELLIEMKNEDYNFTFEKDKISFQSHPYDTMDINDNLPYLNCWLKNIQINQPKNMAVILNNIPLKTELMQPELYYRDLSEKFIEYPSLSCVFEQINSTGYIRGYINKFWPFSRKN
ncbi:Signal recognition particle protein [Intoshia linei]|uniref:Signal recognition particle subunit SRP68 n=1 Tax=Intoshia linei TaxID=1819745 RepID=A0A177BBY7_9BILA|nr:Signal recognition particle protein [Intoshia linei]